MTTERPALALAEQERIQGAVQCSRTLGARSALKILLNDAIAVHLPFVACEPAVSFGLPFPASSAVPLGAFSSRRKKRKGDHAEQRATRLTMRQQREIHGYDWRAPESAAVFLDAPYGFLIWEWRQALGTKHREICSCSLQANKQASIACFGRPFYVIKLT
jgi:hypothetical protein